MRKSRAEQAWQKLAAQGSEYTSRTLTLLLLESANVLVSYYISVRRHDARVSMASFEKWLFREDVPYYSMVHLVPSERTWVSRRAFEWMVAIVVIQARTMVAFYTSHNPSYSESDAVTAFRTWLATEEAYNMLINQLEEEAVASRKHTREQFLSRYSLRRVRLPATLQSPQEDKTVPVPESGFATYSPEVPTGTYHHAGDDPLIDEGKLSAHSHGLSANRTADLDGIIDSIERQSTCVSLAEMARTLSHLLSGELTAYMVGLKSERSIQRWVSGARKQTRREAFVRLLTAYEIARLITHYHTPLVAKSWFLGLKSSLDYITPAEAIRQKKLREVKLLAKEFVAVATNL